MKKKILAICLMLVMALAAVVVAGCSAFNEVGNLTWVEKPKETYSLNESDALTFKIQVELNNGTTETLEYPEDKDKFTVEGFSTETLGTKKLTVKYAAPDGEISLIFTYNVVDDRFADGSGSYSDPYHVSTVAQFQNLLDNKSFAYYVLDNSIDFANATLKMANFGDAFKSVEEAVAGGWSGHIDGKTFSLMNIKKVVAPDGTVLAKHNELFGFVKNFTMENITVNFKAEGTGAVSALIGSNVKGGKILMNKVNFTGTMNAADIGNLNISPVISNINDEKGVAESVEFTYCNNSVQILNSYAVPHVAGYFNIYKGSEASAKGWSLFGDKKNVVKFENCTFTGTIESSTGNVASFAAINETDNNSNLGWLSMTNCSDKGATMVKTYQDPVPVAANATAFATINGNIENKTLANIEHIDTINITKVTGTDTEYSLKSSVEVDKYVVFASMSVKYTDNNKGGGGFVAKLGTFEDLTKEATVKLPKLKFDATTTGYDLSDNTYGSALISKSSDDNLTFYAYTLRATLSSDKCSLIAVGYKNGEVVSVGKVGNIEGIVANA